jgi:type IV secretory pathway TraG/TraD family ATPase VirD4
MNTPNFPLPSWLQKILDWIDYGKEWLEYYVRMLEFCLLTQEGRADFRHWPLFVWITLGVALLVINFVVSRLVNPSPRYRGKYIRGTRLVVMRGYWWKRWLWPWSALVVGRVRWPRKLEPLNLLMAGGPGTGKSLAIHGVLDTLRWRGDLAIVTDVGSEALKGFGKDGDALLNPFDERSEPWSPFAEMDGPHDADRLAKSMIPDGQQGVDPDWIRYSQTLVGAVLRQLWEKGTATNQALLRALTFESPKELKQLVQGLPAQAMFHEGAEKMLASVRGVVSSHLEPYYYLPADAGAKSWSIRRHVREGKGWLWLPYREDQRAGLRPLLATWLGEAINAMLSSPPDLNRRRWLLLDEVASLGCVQGLSDALTRGRKHGLCAILGLQSVAQLRSAYGDDGAQTLLSCLSSQLILRANDPETAKYASEHLGQCELERTSVTRGKVGETTRTRVRHTEDLVLPSEIQALPDRRGYLRLAGQHRVRCVKIPVVKRAQVIEPFVPRSSAPPAPPPVAAPPPTQSLQLPLDAEAILKPKRSEG